MPYYSPSTGGFYLDELHGDAMPADVVKISQRRHAELMAAQAAGAAIVAGKRGPIASKASRDELAGAAIAAVKREARRRIRRIASAERQANDNALIAQAALALAVDCATELDFVPALERRRRIDAVRAFSNELELELAELGAAKLAAFRATAAEWPEF